MSTNTDPTDPTDTTDEQHRDLHDVFHLRRTAVADLASHDRIRNVFVQACNEGATAGLRRDLRMALPEAGFDRHAPSDDDLDAVLQRGAGYMEAVTRTRHQDLQRVEDRIGTLETALAEYRDVRAELSNEFDRLSRETGVTVTVNATATADGEGE